jgi:hypothetical protein
MTEIAAPSTPFALLDMTNRDRPIQVSAKSFFLRLNLNLSHRSRLQSVATDATNAAIASASVSLTNTETSERRTAETDGNGAYQFLILPPGYYRLEVEKKGFK